MNRFQGIFTPIITPIKDDESPDLDSVVRLVEFQLSHGVHGFWAMGTSGEFASFDEHEREAVISAVVRAVDGQVPVIANASDASTRMTIRHGLRAMAAGADAVAATPPYYYPHSQDEVLAHFNAIRAAVDAPLFLYNIPQTVRVRIEQETAQRLVRDGAAQGIKDSQNDLEWFRELAQFGRAESQEFALFAGTRHLIDAAILAGGHGAIPNVANLMPDVCVRVFHAAWNGDFRQAAEAERPIIEHEAVVRGIKAGSRNAATLGILKANLQHMGVIAHAGLTAPLRVPRADEVPWSGAAPAAVAD